MIANYGYQDGTGEYYIAIDTAHCAECPVDHACLKVCPQQMFEIVEDDYGDSMSWIKEEHRCLLIDDCASCKKTSGHAGLPCVVAGTGGAIEHSW